MIQRFLEDDREKKNERLAGQIAARVSGFSLRVWTLLQNDKEEDEDSAKDDLCLYLCPPPPVSEAPFFFFFAKFPPRNRSRRLDGSVFCGYRLKKKMQFRENNQ